MELEAYPVEPLSPRDRVNEETFAAPNLSRLTPMPFDKQSSNDEMRVFTAHISLTKYAAFHLNCGPRFKDLSQLAEVKGEGIHETKTRFEGLGSTAG